MLPDSSTNVLIDYYHSCEVSGLITTTVVYSTHLFALFKSIQPHNELYHGIMSWSSTLAVATLQELKLQGIKIRDVVVLSQYSRA